VGQTEPNSDGSLSSLMQCENASEQHLNESVHSQGTGSVECCVLAKLLQKKCPRLMAAFCAIDCCVHDLTSAWFSHLFATSLPSEVVVRVWDCLLCEGIKVFFRVALALLKRQVIAAYLPAIASFQQLRA